MTVKDIYDFLDSIAPFSSQADWDNSGLIVGDYNAPVKKTVICLDVTEKEISFAKNNDADLIISHHPVIFRPQKKFLSSDPAFLAAANSINILCAHTNLDKAENGVNDTLCKTVFNRFEKIASPVADGFLNIGYLDKAVSSHDFARHLKDKLGSDVNYCYGNGVVSKVGVCCGSGSDFIKDAVVFGCDAYLTGDASYHTYLDSDACGVALFAAGHYDTEILIVSELQKTLSSVFTETEFISYSEKSPVLTVT